MKKIIKMSFVLTVFILLLTGCAKDNNESTKINVTSSVYIMSDIANKIGGDKVEIKQIVPDGVEPHDWEPQAKDIIDVEKSDLFVYNGAGLEHWVDSVLESNNKIKSIETTKSLSLIANDPHTWLDPSNVKKQMFEVKEALTKLDTNNKEYYEDNYNKYAKELDDLDKQYKESLKDIKSRDIIVSHEAFGYLAKAYDLKQVGISGIEPGAEPDAAKMNDIIEFVDKNNVKTIFYEEGTSDKVATVIAKQTKTNTAVLSPLESLSQKQKDNNDDYFSIMKENLKQLQTALK